MQRRDPQCVIVFRDGTYLELMALTGQPARAGTPDYSFLFANGEASLAVPLIR